MADDKVTPLFDSVDMRGAELRRDGDPIGAMELLVEDALRRVRELESRVLAAPAAFRRAAEQQRCENDERRAAFGVDTNDQGKP